MKKVTDSLTRKYDVRDLYFHDNVLMTLVKDAPSEEVSLLEDLKAYFGDNDFNLTATMKTDSEVEKPENTKSDEDLE